MRQDRRVTRSRQSGITFLGGAILGAMFVGYFGIGLTAFPLVNEYLGVRTVMKNMAALPPEALPTAKKIESGFTRRANVNSLDNFSQTALRENKGRLVIKTNAKTKTKTIFVRYRAEKSVMGPFYLTMLVHLSVELGTGQTELVSVPYDEPAK